MDNIPTERKKLRHRSEFSQTAHVQNDLQRWHNIVRVWCLGSKLIDMSYVEIGVTETLVNYSIKGLQEAKKSTTHVNCLSGLTVPLVKMSSAALRHFLAVSFS